MNEAEQALYDRILQFSFDEGNEALTFARRLARETGWTPNYTARVIDEYKRFIFLAVVAGHPVTPSDQVGNRVGNRGQTTFFQRKGADLDSFR